MIDFQNVSFAYEKGDPVIDGISFTIPSGESVGLIGANGAGKSTVMKLLLGLLQGEGTIRVGGTPVIKENLAKIRAGLGFVMQNSDNQMFMPTVYEDMITEKGGHTHGFTEAARDAYKKISPKIIELVTENIK
jgi:cobalt/nickel transport system ATP-binding protein